MDETTVRAITVRRLTVTGLAIDWIRLARINSGLASRLARFASLGPLSSNCGLCLALRPAQLDLGEASEGAVEAPSDD